MNKRGQWGKLLLFLIIGVLIGVVVLMAWERIQTGESFCKTHNQKLVSTGDGYIVCGTTNPAGDISKYDTYDSKTGEKTGK